MTDWQSLLDWLASGPRENGTAALAQTAARIADTLRAIGLEPDIHTYTAYPLRLRLIGIVTLAGVLLFARWMKRGKPTLAASLVVGLTVLLLAEGDGQIPVVSWIGARPQQNISVTIPAENPTRHVLLTAHYDSKTDALDHLERAPVDFLGLPVSLLLLASALVARRKRLPVALRRFVSGTGIAYGLAAFTALTAGAFLTERSHGAADDGAACATLLRLADRLHKSPPTDANVTLVFLSGEEIGVQGSWHYARDRFPTPPTIPTFVINLEALGLSSQLAIFGGETFTLRRYAPDPLMAEAANQVHQQRFQKDIWTTPYSGATDARSFLARGIPALTLMSRPHRTDTLIDSVHRGMHSRLDRREQIETANLEANARFLEVYVHRVGVPNG